MNKIIYNIPDKIRLEAIQNFDFDELEKVEEREKTKIFDLFNKFKNKVVRVAWYDSKHVHDTANNEVRFMRYALHRSTRYADKLQLSVIYCVNDEFFPTSHSDINLNCTGVNEFCNSLPEYVIINLIH